MLIYVLNGGRFQKSSFKLSYFKRFGSSLRSHPNWGQPFTFYHFLENQHENCSLRADIECRLSTSESPAAGVKCVEEGGSDGLQSAQSSDSGVPVCTRGSSLVGVNQGRTFGPKIFLNISDVVVTNLQGYTLRLNGNFFK